MNEIIASVRGEFARYKALGEGALKQLDDAELSLAPQGDGNSAANIVLHVGGNLASRFTDFQKSDGEKPWRDRESEFAPSSVTRSELMEKWEKGWSALYAALGSLTDESLGATVTIRGQPLTIREALHRSLAHTSYHVGQVVFLARSIRGAQWSFLSIPPGRSDAYNRNPTLEQRPSVVTGPAELLAERLERTFSGPMWHGPSLGDLLGDVAPAEAVARPVASGHSIGELVRHMTAWADIARARLAGGGEGEPPEAEDWPPLGKTLDEADWKGCRAALEASYRALAAATRALGAGQMAAAVKGRRHTVEDMIRGVVEHGTYHGGQVALLLRALRGPARR